MRSLNLFVASWVSFDWFVEKLSSVGNDKLCVVINTRTPLFLLQFFRRYFRTIKQSLPLDSRKLNNQVGIITLQIGEVIVLVI